MLRSFNRMNELVPTAHAEGEVLFHGQNLYADDVDPVEVRRRIGMVFQKPNPFPKSIYDNIAWGSKINGFKGGKGDMDELVKESLNRRGIMGRSSRQIEPEWVVALRWSTAAVVHRPHHCCKTGYHPDG